MWEWNDEDTPSRLISAVWNADVGGVRELLSEGEDPNARFPVSPEGSTTVSPLGAAFGLWAHEGADEGLEIFDLLLAAGARTDWMLQVAEDRPMDVLDSLNELRSHFGPEELVPMGRQVLSILRKRAIEIDTSRLYLEED